MNDPIDWNQRYTTGNTPWDSGMVSKELLRVLAEHRIAPCRMLELGCGTGTNAIHLAKNGFEVAAIDVASLALEQARVKARHANVAIDFREVDILRPHDLGGPFRFVFDRGVYHSLRGVGLWGFLQAISRATEVGGFYLTLAGNANDPTDEDKGPPRVHAHELCQELAPLFHLVQLREFTFDGVKIDGELVAPLGWSALLRRRPTE